MPETSVPTRPAPTMHIVASETLDPDAARTQTSSRTYVYDSARRRPRFIEEFFALIAYRDLVMQLVSRNVKTRYKRSVLGVAWTMLNPLMMMTVLAIVFSTLFTAKIENYPVFLLTGLTLWGFFQQTSAGIMTELTWGGSLLSKIYVPPSVFAISAVGTGLVNMVLSLVPLILIMLVTGAPITPAILFLPIPMLFVCMFALGLGLILARLAIFFADIAEMYSILLMIWFYATPIIYPIELVRDEKRMLLQLNPVHYLLEIFRAPVYLGVLPPLQDTLIAGAISVVMLTIGWWYFTKKVDEFAYRV
jgi:ABC-type polysaccharide/polyol phosphate export permease